MLVAKEFRHLQLEEQLQKKKLIFLIGSYKRKITNEDLTNKMKASKLKELQKKLQDLDIYYHDSDDDKAYRKGKA
jgi:hypothetical protein